MLLLNEGASPNTCPKGGTALTCAVDIAHSEIVFALLKAGQMLKGRLERMWVAWNSFMKKTAVARTISMFLLKMAGFASAVRILAAVSETPGGATSMNTGIVLTEARLRLFGNC